LQKRERSVKTVRIKGNVLVGTGIRRWPIGPSAQFAREGRIADVIGPCQWHKHRRSGSKGSIFAAVVPVGSGAPRSHWPYRLRHILTPIARSAYPGGSTQIDRTNLMSITQPYRGTSRQLDDGSYANSGNGRYVRHAKYDQDPEHYVRAYLLLQKDLEELFDYVEPSDQNLGSYSYRIHELLLRACVEVEANCKAILLENGYPTKPKDLDMRDYIKIEGSHKLSAYQVRVLTWSGLAGLRVPFRAWGSGGGLPWYRAYNTTKHDRHAAFRTATFEHMLDAVCGCLVICRRSSKMRTSRPGRGTSV
jgi:hypothetical protein